MGSINIDNTGSGADVTLSSDGTDLLLDGTAIGGGGSALQLYAENPSSPTTPTATGTNAVAIGDNARATNTNTIALGTANATLQRAFAVNTGSSTTYGAKHNDTVSLAEFSQATSSMAVAIGRSATATGVESLAFGKVSQATASSAIALGQRTLASANYAVALGFYSSSSIKGKYAYAGERFAAAGDGQTGTYVLLSDTTDATAEALTTSKSTASTDNQVILPNNSAYSFSGTIIARESATDGSDYASWEIKGALLRDANAASTVLGNGIVNKLYATSGASAWAVALTADTTNGGLKVEVTGAATTNIRWVATVHTSEVTYA